MKGRSKKQIPVGVILRYSDHMLDSSTSTVEEHNKILRKEGKVWFGKFGKGFSAGLITALNQPGLELTFIAVRPKKRTKDDTQRTFGAHCLRCQTERPPAKLIPSYYRHLIPETWFCLTSELKPLMPPQLERWLIVSSEQPATSALASTPRSFFLVTTRAHLAEARLALGIKAAQLVYSPKYGTRLLGRPRRGLGKRERALLEGNFLNEDNFSDTW